MGNIRCVAVDWSGSIDESDQLAHIWVAEAEQNNLVRLRNGFTRDEVVACLIQETIPRGAVVIGFDFAFSFPQWYQQHHTLDGARDLWDLAGREGENWLAGQMWPFWGRPGPYQQRPENLTTHCRFRQTDKDHVAFQPKSVFQIYGAGAVGTGTIRGVPALAHLNAAGAAIWPFDHANHDGATVIEIYPRLFYGTAVTNNGSVRGRNTRSNFLETHYRHLEQHWKDTMIGSPDAFDAGVSALVMSQHAGELGRLQGAAQPRYLVEGEMWPPADRLNPEAGIFPPE